MLRTLLGTALWLFAAPAWAADLPPSLGAVVEDAAAQQLPVGPLEAKAAEGLAKGVPEARIEAVLDGMVRELLEARVVLGQAPDAVVFAASRALKAGASEQAVRSLASGTHGDRALHSLADLLAMGVAEADAVRVVQVASASGSSDKEIAGLATSTAALVSRGSSPNEAALTVLGGLAGQNNGVGSLPDGAPGKKDNPGNGVVPEKGSKGKAPVNPRQGKP